MDLLIHQKMFLIFVEIFKSSLPYPQLDNGEKGNKYFQKTSHLQMNLEVKSFLNTRKYKERYAKKLIVLRLSGLYDSLTKEKPLNHLHRDNAAKIIKFFVKMMLSFFK